MTALHHRSRAGFTLIELLVVVAILAVLSAIGVGAFFRVRASSEIKANETTVAKMTTGLNKAWSAGRDSAEKEFKDNTYSAQIATITTIAGGDRDRAKALWMYFRMKNEFPQTFAEAKAATTFAVTVGGTVYSTNSTVVLPTLFLPAKRTYLANTALNTAVVPAPVAPVTAADQVADQAAILLYILITEKGSRGEMFADEAAGALTGKVTIGSNEFKVFTDTYGKPLTYARYATNGEITTPPFTKTGVTSQDPFDPLNKLGAPWTIPGNATQATPAVVAAGLGLTGFGVNWLPSIICSGPNKNFDGLNVAPTSGLVTIPTDTDNILGYRLRREGERGN